jgi:hypothetical protein
MPLRGCTFQVGGGSGGPPKPAGGSPGHGKYDALFQVQALASPNTSVRPMEIVL